MDQMIGLELCRPCAEDPLSTLLWANKVAIERFGHIRPRAEQGQHLANADPDFVADRQRRITLSEQEVLVSRACSCETVQCKPDFSKEEADLACINLQGRGNSLHFVLNIKKALFITFDNVRDDEGFASIYTRVCVIFDHAQHSCLVVLVARLLWCSLHAMELTALPRPVAHLDSP